MQNFRSTKTIAKSTSVAVITIMDLFVCAYRYTTIAVSVPIDNLAGYENTFLESILEVVRYEANYLISEFKPIRRSMTCKVGLFFGLFHCICNKSYRFADLGFFLDKPGKLGFQILHTGFQ